MAWRFRKSFSPLPGIRLTLSPSGVSTSVGVGPFRLTAGSGGAAFNTNISGTGLSFRQPLSSGIAPAAPSLREPFTPRVVAPLPVSHGTPLADIKSGGSEALTTAGLDEFKRLLEQARREYRETSRELASACVYEQASVGGYNRWKNGWLLRRVFKAKYQQLAADAAEAIARREELQEQESLSRLSTQIDLPQGVSQAFQRMRDDFSLLAKAARVWDTVGQRNTNRLVERTAATRIVSREPVSFCLGKCELIESEWNVPHMANANGGDIFLYPAFVLYFVTADTFALLEFKEVDFGSSTTRFFEEEALPHDSKVVGQTWAKTNKDGMPDRRFKDNYQIPVVEYGKVVLSSATGLNEEYMISNAEHTDAFAKSWRQFVLALHAGV